MVGDDQLGPAGAADDVFDEALAIVGAGAVDALAAAVGDAGDEARAEQLGHPAGQVAAEHVPVRRGGGPAGDQAERDGDGVAGRHAGDLLLQVEQAQIVLAPLADDDAAAAFGRVREQAGELGVDLALQVLGVGADPDGGAVALGPQAGGRDIGEGLAGAGAGFGEDEGGVAGGAAGGEGGGGGAGVVGLARALFGAGAEHAGQAGAGLGGADGVAGGRRGRRFLLPFGQVLPDAEAAGAGAGGRVVQGGEDRAGPGPAGGAHQRGQSGGVLVARQAGAGAELGEQGFGDGGQQGGGVLERVGRREVEREGEAARGGRRGPGRLGEGEQLEQVERRGVAQVEAAQGGGGVDEQRRRFGAQQGGGLGGGEGEQFAVARQDRRAAMPGDDARRVGQQDGEGGGHAVV